jgi:hypothetical protein
MRKEGSVSFETSHDLAISLAIRVDSELLVQS